MVVYTLNLSTIALFKVSLFLMMHIPERNDILENGQSLDGWSTFGEGSIALSNNQPLSNALPVQMRFTLTDSSTASSSFGNAGFYSIYIQPQTIRQVSSIGH